MEHRIWNMSNLENVIYDAPQDATHIDHSGNYWNEYHCLDGTGDDLTVFAHGGKHGLTKLRDLKELLFALREKAELEAQLRKLKKETRNLI